MSLLSFIVSFAALFIFIVLFFEWKNDASCVISSKFSKVLWCKYCDRLEIGEGVEKLCSRCGNTCVLVKF
jgi:hypothetical protein